MIKTRPALILCACALLAGQVLAAPINPQRQESREVRRVPSRMERPVVLFPSGESWGEVERQAIDGVETRSFAPASPLGEPAVDFITITVMHDKWNTDLERAQHLFGREMSADCPGVNARLVLADSLSLRRRLVAWTCESADPPFAALQLLLQGKDDLFSIEVYARTGIPSDGLRVRWSEWLKDITLCDRAKGAPPCPDNNWDN